LNFSRREPSDHAKRLHFSPDQPIPLTQELGFLPTKDIEAMHMLYDSDAFAVVHILANALQEGEKPAHPGPQMPRHGFEIVDKRSGKEVYLDGSWAEMFQLQITAWQNNTPSEEEVEDTLEGYATLAQMPVVMH
jgi:hypothetical protein